MKQKHPVLFAAILLAASLGAAQAQTAQTFSPGLLKLEVWTNCPGYTVADLTASTNYPASPDEVHYLPRFEIPPGKYITGNAGGTPEGEKLSGFIVPAETTNYVFYVSANYEGQLWLSTDDSPTNLQMIAEGEHDVLSREYDLAFNSSPIALVAGQRYYVEALQKSGPEQGNYGQVEENLAVTWTVDTAPPPQTGADPISGQFLGILTAADTTPPAAITNLAVLVNLAGATYLDLQWTAPRDPGNTNPVAQYDLRYSTQPITSNNWATATPVDMAFVFSLPAGSVQSLRVNSLTQATEYYFALRSEDAAGNLSQLSNVAFGQTSTPVNGMNVLWSLAFPVAGADPTLDGSWIVRGGDLSAATWANLVTNGTLTTPSFSPILDSRPPDSFTNPWIVEVVCKCLDVVAPGDLNGWSGADFFCNMDTRGDGYFSQFAFGLALLADGTQTLGFNIDNVYVQNYDGLSADFHDIRVDVDTTNMLYTVYIDSENMGTNSYTRNSNGNGQGNTAPYASVLGWSYTAQWKSVLIGVPAPPSPPTLQISRTAGGVAISWPAAATGYTLQTTPGLSPANWTNAGSPTVQGDMNVFTTTVTGPVRFYRLSQ